MIKRIYMLSEISFKNYIDKIQLFKNNKINKKSISLWLVLIIMLLIVLFTQQFILQFRDYGQMELFLELLFACMFLLMLFQASLIMTNILYFSNDIELYLPLPLKPTEIIISKYITVVLMLYIIEIIVFFPVFFVYIGYLGITLASILGTIFTLILLPMFITAIIGILNIFFINIIKFIKNKQQFEIFTVILIMLTTILIEYCYLSNALSNENSFNEQVIDLSLVAQEFNKLTIVNESLIQIINKEALIINICKEILLFLVLFVIFILIANKNYIKKILYFNNYNKKKVKKINLNKKIKSGRKKIYLKNEFRSIFKNSISFIQLVYPVITLQILSIFIFYLIKVFLIDENLEMQQMINEMYFNIEGFCAILIAIVIIISFNNISITSISRMGLACNVLKYIPLNYKIQFFLKAIPQIVFNSITILIVVISSKIIFIHISYTYLIPIITCAMILNILISYLMLLVDIKRPFIDWTNEYEIVKYNKNKAFQYMLSFCIVVLLWYFSSVAIDIDLNISISIVMSILIIMLIIINYIIIRLANRGKLFNNIY